MRDFFERIVSVNTDLIWITLLTICFTAEQVIQQDLLKKKLKHFLHGIPLQAGYMLMNLGLAYLVVNSVEWINKQEIGLFNLIKIPYILKIVLGVIGIDLVAYWFHRSYHTIPLLWRLHRVHHSDTHMDSATYLRFHPFDWLLDNSALLTAAFLFGLDMNIIAFDFILYLPLFMAHHSSFIFPEWFDKTFGKLIVSPNFHKVHHHQEQTFTDSNYGNIFIIWDKLFGTYKYLPLTSIKYGLEEFDTEERQSFWFLLKSPFMNIKKENND
jgi:sterol desaturase/sphingolipid hydroxylase (fatty acid hydroxylase superfamily)